MRKLSKKELEAIDAFEEAAEKAGGYVERNTKVLPYSIRNMHKWCVANNRDIETLTPAEREMFRVVPQKPSRAKPAMG